MASAEVGPFARTGGLGDVVGSLPKALADRGHEVTLFTPFHRQTREYLDHHPQNLETVADFTMLWSGWTADITVLRGTLPGSEVPVMFIVNDQMFDRSPIYAMGPAGDDHLERFTVFCRAVVTAATDLDLEYDIVHAHDWHAALLPIYMRSEFGRNSPLYTAASVYTIHNLSYQGRYGGERFVFLGLHREFWDPGAVEYFGDVNLMKGAVIFADQVTTVSPTYAREIQTPEGGAGLDGILRDAAHKLTGILNGVDVDEWDPSTDPNIPGNYDGRNFTGKARCKRELRKEAGLRASAETPLVCGISRLVEQKGFDLFIPTIPKLVQLGIQVVVLGSGDAQLEEALAQAERDHRGEVRAFIQFDPALAHRITAGSDLLVMPSRFEPCGLNQMYALRYATLPVVRLTGGLADTVIPFDGTNEEQANGFGFRMLSPYDVHRELWIAKMSFHDRNTWRRLQRNGMNEDFSWDASARQYEDVYTRARTARGVRS